MCALGNASPLLTPCSPGPELRRTLNREKLELPPPLFPEAGVSVRQTMRLKAKGSRTLVEKHQDAGR